ncbi:superoxide dismutase [archaeon]|nr:superoxide dismutase [archaeon]
MVHELIELPFKTDSLEPFMDEETVKIHYGKHHKAYVDNLNKAIMNYPELEGKSVEWLLTNLDNISEEIRQKVINHGGGVYNHNFFWEILKKDTKIPNEIETAIIERFQSLENFKEEFKNQSLGVFGSGWTWLVLDKNELKIVQTFNQESVISKGMFPLIAIDVWEHSYYLKYQNRRAEYIDNFFNIINWEKVNELFLEEKQ